jgi:hypothetical protein
MQSMAEKSAAIIGSHQRVGNGVARAGRSSCPDRIPSPPRCSIGAEAPMRMNRDMDWLTADDRPVGAPIEIVEPAA